MISVFINGFRGKHEKLLKHAALIDRDLPAFIKG
jgi:hypothetical protein